MVLEGVMNESNNESLNDTSGIDLPYGEEEKEACHICGKRVVHLDKHILANHGEKVLYTPNALLSFVEEIKIK